MASVFVFFVDIAVLPPALGILAIKCVMSAADSVAFLAPDYSCGSIAGNGDGELISPDPYNNFSVRTAETAF